MTNFSDVQIHAIKKLAVAYHKYMSLATQADKEWFAEQDWRDLLVWSRLLREVQNEIGVHLVPDGLLEDIIAVADMNLKLITITTAAAS